MTPLVGDTPAPAAERPRPAAGGFAPRRLAGLLYMLALSGAALGIVLFGLFGEPLSSLGGPFTEHPFLAFFLLALAVEARILAFPVGSITMSLDTPVVITAIFHLGPAPACVVVLVAVYAHALWRHLRGDPFGGAHDPSWGRILQLLFVPLVTAALAALLASAVELPGQGLASGPWTFLEISAWVLGTYVAFVLLQYGAVLLAYALEGYQLGRMLRAAVVPGIGAELSLVPAAILFVWAFDPANPFPFVVLGVVHLFVGDIFWRLAVARSRTQETIDQLEWLIKTGERVFAVLNERQVLQELVAAIDEQVPDAVTTVAGIWDEEERRYSVGVRRADGSFVLDPGAEGLSPLLDRAAQVRAPAIFHASADGERFDLAVVPFAMGEQREGYIAVTMAPSGPPTARSDARLERALAALEALRRMAGIAGIAIHNARLYRLATIDGLTGLYVRRYFDRRYAEEVARSRRYGKPLTLILIDLDDFKTVNDTFGHPVGDRVLEEVARTVRLDIRNVDVPCRYGGDEFVLLLPETGLDEARDIAGRLQRRIEGISLLHEGQVVRFSTSLGVACYDPTVHLDVPDLLEEADQALYRAKAISGKGRVVVANS